MKEQRDRTRTQLILYFLKGSKRYFALTVLFACFLAVFDLVNPKLIGYAVDYILGSDLSELPPLLVNAIEQGQGRDFGLSHIWLIALLVIGFALLGAGFRYLFQICNSVGAEKFVERTHNLLYEHISHLPFSWQDENQTGDIIQRCTSDVDTIKAFLSEQLTNLVRIVLMLLLAIFFMFRIHLVLALVALVFIPVIVAYSMFFFHRMEQAFEQVDEEEGVLSTMVQENLTGVRVVRAFGRERYEIDRFHAENDRYTDMWVDLMRLLSTFWSANDLISGAQVLTVVALGAYFTVDGQLTAGSYVAFVAYNAMLTFPIRQLGRLISAMSKAGISIDRLNYIMNSPIEEDLVNAIDFPAEEAGPKDIVFEHVSFSYDEKHPVLQDVSFTVPAGSSVGIIGKTGSGKSTVALLLDRLYDLKDGEEAGRITIAGIDLRQIKRSQVRQHIGMVLQEPYLFSRSLAENLTIAKENSREEMEQAVEDAALSSTIDRFEKGYDTFVGERGVTLSGGQKQRTAIARMFLQNPEIMIFDDSLSAVDAKTDDFIRKSIRVKSKDLTTIIISHRISTVMNCDQIVVLENGRVAESGSPEQLLAAGGIYKEIYDLQTSGKNVEGGSASYE